MRVPSNPPALVEKIIVPSSAHVPPRSSGALQSLTTGPPVTATLRSSPPAKNATHWPSALKNGLAAPSVPSRTTASNRSSFRTNRRLDPACCPTNASVVPSGDRIAEGPRPVGNEASAPMAVSSLRGPGERSTCERDHFNSATPKPTPKRAARAQGSDASDDRRSCD